MITFDEVHVYVALHTVIGPRMRLSPALPVQI